MAASTGKAAIVCCGLGMLRCSEIDLLLILYCLAPPGNVLVSFWYTMYLADILAAIWGAGWRNAALARAGPLAGGAGGLRPCPSACETRRPTSSVGASGPKPGMDVGSVKSHWFSARPMKSRMAGSTVQARRSAALVNSAGTPAAKNARMSLPDVMVSMSGSAGSSGAGCGGGRPSPAAPGAVSSPRAASGVGLGGSSAVSGRWRSSRFKRDQRVKNVSDLFKAGPPRSLAGAPVPRSGADRGDVCRTGARRDVRRQRPRPSRRRRPASARSRPDRCPPP